MKILHLISQPPDFTGSGKFISQLIRQSAAHGHQNILLAGAQKNFQLSPGLPPASHHHLVRFEQEIPFPIPGMSDIMPYESRRFSSLTEQELSTYKQMFLEAVRTLTAQHRPDIIHSHHLWILSALSREILPDIPMVTSCHGTCLRQHRLCPEIGLSLVNSLGSINRIIALSGSQENEIHHLLKIPSARIDVISGGFDPDCFFDAPKPYDGTVHLLFAGKLSPAKGLIWLLNSLREIKNQPFCLHIAGSSSEKEKKACLDLAATLGDKVRYHGVLSHQELGALMRRSHLFILPSFFEGVPLVGHGSSRMRMQNYHHRA